MNFIFCKHVCIRITSVSVLTIVFWIFIFWMLYMKEFFDIHLSKYIYIYIYTHMYVYTQMFMYTFKFFVLNVRAFSYVRYLHKLFFFFSYIIRFSLLMWFKYMLSLKIKFPFGTMINLCWTLKSLIVSHPLVLFLDKCTENFNLVSSGCVSFTSLSI